MSNQKTQEDNNRKLKELTDNLKRLKNIKDDLQQKIDAKGVFKAMKLVKSLCQFNPQDGKFEPNKNDPSYLEAIKDFFDVAPAEKAIKGIYEQFVPVDIKKANKNADILQKFQQIEKVFEHQFVFKKTHETDDIKLSVINQVQ